MNINIGDIIEYELAGEVNVATVKEGKKIYFYDMPFDLEDIKIIRVLSKDKFDSIATIRGDIK